MDENRGCAQAHSRARRLDTTGAALLLFALGFGQGCYVYRPVESGPSIGTTLAVDLTDNGRVGMGEQIGVSARTIEGVVRTQDDSAYVFNVSSILYLNGQQNRWSGEPLKVSRQFVTNPRQRQFSPSRTALAAAIGVGGVVAFIVSRGLLGLGNGPRDPGPPPPPDNQ
jgi:hypothetical protein